MPVNQAAIVPGMGMPFTVDDVELPQPEPNEVIVWNKAVAINPVDWVARDFGLFMKDFPRILGEDLAGEIFAVGSNVTKFKKGDRVLGAPDHLLTGTSRTASFQTYTAISSALVAHIPASLPFENATVLPLAISTTALGLYGKDLLNLPLPTTPSPNPAGKGKTLLIWGGASSVGSVAIQLAVASGFRVVSTASAHNIEYVKKLGADVVIDYKRDDAIQAVVDVLKANGFVAVYDAIAESAIKDWAEVVKRVGKKVPVTSVRDPTENLPDDYPSDFPKPTTHYAFKIGEDEKLTQAIWGDFVPRALEDGTLKAEPQPIVVGHGLDKIQEAAVRQRKGVSAAKIVVTL